MSSLFTGIMAGGFGHITDSPAEAVDLIKRSLPAALKSGLKPTPVS